MRVLQHWTPLSLAFLLASGCTLVSGVGDFEVGDASLPLGQGDASLDAEADAELDAEADAEADADADAPDAIADAAPDAPVGFTEPSDLTVTLEGMFPHQTQFVDLALVDNQQRLQARALVRLPRTPDTGVANYPDVTFEMSDALVFGTYDVAFYADVNGSGTPDPAPTDHSWLRPVESDGSLSFGHNTDFNDLTELDITPVGADAVLAFPSGAEDPRPVLEAGDKILEIQLTLIADDRTVGLFQLHPDTGAIPDKLTLVGIVDAGNVYEVQAFQGGSAVAGSRQEVTAPVDGNLELTLTRTLLGL